MKLTSDAPRKCGAIVQGDGSVWMRGHACGRRAKVEQDGKLYCGLHDPEKTKVRNAEREARWAVKDAAASAKARVAELRNELAEAVLGYDGALPEPIALLRSLTKHAQGIE